MPDSARTMSSPASEYWVHSLTRAEISRYLARAQRFEEENLEAPRIIAAEAVRYPDAMQTWVGIGLRCVVGKRAA
jgi:hypothetical protein